MVYFSASTLSFIPESWKNDGTYKDDDWPHDAVLLSNSEAEKFWKKLAPSGKILGFSVSGRPSWVDIPDASPPSRDEIESIRLRAYADPLIGSDRLFSESARMQIMGEPGYDDVKSRAISRFEEIQAQYPWPTE